MSFFSKAKERIASFDSAELSSIDVPVFEQNNVTKEITLPVIIIPSLSTSYALLTPRIEYSIPSLLRPQIVLPFFTTFQKANLQYQDLNLGQLKIVNVLDILYEYPILENIPLQLKPSEITGKNYVQKIVEKVEGIIEELFDHAEENYKSHVVGDSLRETKTQKMDLFDLLKPLLYPPVDIKLKDNHFFKADPKPWQPKGIDFLKQNRSALLADDMGLGKTIQSIIALKILFRDGEVRKCLILAKKSLLKNWQRELWDWAPELSTLIIASPTNQVGREILWNTPVHIYITNYENLLNDQSIWLKQNNFEIVILDEIQDLKNPKAEKTKAAKLLGAKWKWGLSGTPLENKIEDIHSIFSIIKPELNLSESDSIEQLKAKIAPYFLRRKADDLPGMAGLVKKITWLELSESQRLEYDIAEQNGVTEIERQGKAATSINIIALITRLKIICNLAQNGESSKLDNLVEKLIEVVEQGHKALVVSQYPNVTFKKILPKLRSFNPIIFDGILSMNAREKIEKSFQNNDECKVLLLSVKSAALGLTLTRANYVFHFDHWWNPAVGNQATGRARRIGQLESHVFEFSLFCSKTIEERIYQLLEQKRNLFQNVVDDLSTEVIQEKLTAEDLFGLFGLKSPKSIPVTISSNVSSARSGSIMELTGIQFEEIIAEYFRRINYSVRMTPRSNDGGVDIYVKGAFASGEEHLIVQCKRYSLQNPVSREIAQQMFGILSSDHSLTKAIIVTTSRFTSHCKDFCEDKRIDLWDGPTVLRKLHDVGLWS